MSTLADNGKYVSLEGVRVFHRKSDDSIHLVSTDPDLDTSAFHVSLTKNTPTDAALRKLLSSKNPESKIPQDTDNFPRFAPYPKDKTFESPMQFPLGVAQGGETVLCDFSIDPHWVISAGTGDGSTVAFASLVYHALQHQDFWRVISLASSVQGTTSSDAGYPESWSMHNTPTEAYSYLQEVNVILERRIHSGGQGEEPNILILLEESQSLLRLFDVFDKTPLKIPSVGMTIPARDIIQKILMAGSFYGIHLVARVAHHANSSDFKDFSGKIFLGSNSYQHLKDLGEIRQWGPSFLSQKGRAVVVGEESAQEVQIFYTDLNLDTSAPHVSLIKSTPTDAAPKKLLSSKSPGSLVPEKAMYPGSDARPWNEFPLGLGINGEVTWDITKVPHMLVTGTTGSGKSVVQRNLIFHTIQHPTEWRFFGIDLKKVELSTYKKYDNVVVNIATELEDALEICRYLNQQMQDRYQLLQDLGLNNFADLPPDKKGYALMLMVDEAYELLSPTKEKTDEGKERDALKAEAFSILASIARLGRAAGVFLVLTAQRPDARIIQGEFKQNLAARIVAGRADSIASNMTLDNDEATRLPGHIRGRAYFQAYGNGQMFQGYFADQSWIDEWLAQQEDCVEEQS